MHITVSKFTINCLIFALIALVSQSCAPQAKVLTKIDLGMTKSEVRKNIGDPESISLSFITNDEKKIEVWDYRLYQYAMATSLSPYFDIYSLVFVNGQLEIWQKTEKGSRLSEDAALRLLGIPDQNIRIEFKK